MRANLVAQADEWRWCNLWRRVHETAADRRWLSPWPLPEPRGWPQLVNTPQTEGELEAIRRSVMRGQPYGRADWVQRTARSLGLETTLRPRGRPRKEPT